MSDHEGTTRRVALQAAAAVVPAMGGIGDAAAQAASDVVGVWRLIGGSVTDETGADRGRPYGPRGMGLVSLTADGRMMAVLVDGRTEVRPGETREYASYCGTYTFENGVLTTTTFAYSDAARFATPQVRKARFEGDRLVLVPPVAERGGHRLTRELVWERISTVSL